MNINDSKHNLMYFLLSHHVSLVLVSGGNNYNIWIWIENDHVNLDSGDEWRYKGTIFRDDILWNLLRVTFG